MLKFEIIDKEAERWNNVVSTASIYDFHHTAYFHTIDTDYPSKLLVASDGGSFIALPIVIRPVDGTSYFDITSVYGYAGPIYHFTDGYTGDDLIKFFQSEFQDFCADQGIVSVFSRLHPLISQKYILSGLGEVIDLNKTVSIDLTLAADEQRKAFRKSLKSELNQLRRKDFVVREAAEDGEIDDFIKIYYETMDRVDAAKSYYFSRSYFQEFLKNADFKAKLLVVLKNGEVIAGAIFTFTDKIIQYHLAGTAEEYIRETPMKLILDEARLLGNTTTASYLHLGGGVGGSDEDSLFRFKSGFAKNFHQFSVWKFVVNQEIYDELSAGKEPSEFFPLYRSLSANI